MDESLLACNSDTNHYSITLPNPSVVMSLDGIDVTFKVVDGKFDVEYDKDKATESAGLFFACLKDYFNI